MLSLQRPSPFTSFLVAALVVANIIGLYSVVQLKGEIQQLQAAVSSQTGLRNDVDRLRSEITVMRQDQEWIGPVDISADSWSKDGISLLATWQIKDFTEGSPVTFHWQGPQDEGFREIGAEGLGGGRFQAKVDEPASIMPEVTVSSGRVGDGKLNKPPERALIERPMLSTYFVSVKTGEVVKSTDAHTADLSKFRTALTYGLSMSVTSDSKKTKTTLTETPNPHTKPAYRLESASIEGYSGTSKVLDLALLNTRISTVPVGSGSVDVPAFEAEMSKPAPALSSLWLNLTYSGGRTVKVELTPWSFQ